MQTTCDDNLRSPVISGILMKMLLKINGRIHYLWRAVDEDGDLLDILIKALGTRKPPGSSSAKLNAAIVDRDG